MEKNVTVTDVFGIVYGATYPKRAKGLVKNGRARFVDDHTVCLVCPPDEFYSEDFFMEYKDNITKEELLKQAEELNRQAEELLKQSAEKTAEGRDLEEKAERLEKSAEVLDDKAAHLDDRADEIEEAGEEAGSESGSDAAEEIRDAAEGLRDEAEEMRDNAEEIRDAAEEAGEEAEKLSKRSEYLKAQATRLYHYAESVYGEASAKVKDFLADHKDEIAEARAVAAEAMAAAGTALKKAFGETKRYAGEAWDYAKEHINVSETKRQAHEAAEYAKVFTSEFEKAAAEAGAYANPGEAHKAAAKDGKKPRLTMEYILGELARIGEDTEQLKAAMEYIRNHGTNDGSGSYLAQMIAAREQTNRDLIFTYTKMYEELRAYPFWSKNQRLQELAMIQKQFASTAPEGFLENLTAQVLSELYLTKEEAAE